MQHIVLLGDSIFDNAPYVDDGDAVIDQLSRMLAPDQQATLLAVDGDVTRDVKNQLNSLPEDATHLFISVGGNDALGHVELLHNPCQTVSDAMDLFATVRERFQSTYSRMMLEALARDLPVTACTVYDSVPGLPNDHFAALAIFNEVILRVASRFGVPIIDLRIVCNEEEDYSPLSPIEPSAQGAAKICREIMNHARVLEG